MRQLVSLAATAGIAAFWLSGALAQDASQYPNRPIRVIVPFGPGGVTDITARNVTPGIAEALSGTIVVENRAGAATILGTEVVAKAKPDGYTVLLTSGGALAANPVLYKQMPFDTVRDLAGVSMISTLPYVLAVQHNSPMNNAMDLIAAAKAKPKALSYASAGSGSGNHLTTELFAAATGVEVLHIPYKSGGAMVTDLLAGVVTFTFSGLPAALPLIKSGKLKALGVTGEVRHASLPDVPTIRDSGVPGFVSMEWTGLFVPTGTPAPIIAKLNAAVASALGSAEAKAKLLNLGADAAPTSGARLDQVLRDDLARWTKLAQTVKFEVQ